jgi:hypothetical protein
VTATTSALLTVPMGVLFANWISGFQVAEISRYYLKPVKSEALPGTAGADRCSSPLRSASQLV